MLKRESLSEKKLIRDFYGILLWNQNNIRYNELDTSPSSSYHQFMISSVLPMVLIQSETIPINSHFALKATGDLRVVFLEGQPVMEFHASDQAARDLIITQLCELGGLTEGEVARAFDISRPTVSRARAKYALGGIKALLPNRGPKGPSKIKDYKQRVMIEMARAGRSKVEIASRLGVNESAVRKALRRLGLEELAVRQSNLAMHKTEHVQGDEAAQGAVAPTTVQTVA